MNFTSLTCQETAEVEWRARLGLFRSVRALRGYFRVCPPGLLPCGVRVCAPGAFSVCVPSGVLKFRGELKRPKGHCYCASLPSFRECNDVR